MSEFINLIECPRDAFQGLPQFVPTEAKIDYLFSLLDAGFTDIDFGSFVSPKAVPQMRDTAEVLEAIRPRLGQARLIAIVPNLKGMDAAIALKDIRCAGFALSASETFQQRNFHQTLEQAWAITGELRARSEANGMEFVVYLSMAFGNPYGDRWSPEHIVSCVVRLVDLGVEKISLADTVGLAQGQSIYDLFSACRLKFWEVELGVHLHARLDRWQQVVMAAYAAGCRRFDGALRGMGGCPFADDHLVGNIPTEGMVRRFSQMGLKMSVTEDSIRTVLGKAGQILSAYS